MTFSAPSVSNVLFLLLAFLPGIFSAFFLSSGALHLSLWSLAPCGILLVRRSSSSLSPLFAGLASSRLYLLLFPLRVGNSSFPTFRNSVPRRNPLLTPYLVPSMSGLYVTSWVPYRMRYPYVLCTGSRFIFIVLPRFLLVRGLFLSLLVLPLVLYPRMRLVSFSVVSFLFLSLLLRILLHPILVLTAFVRSLLLLLFLAMFLSPLSLLLRIGVLLSSLLPVLFLFWVFVGSFGGGGCGYLVFYFVLVLGFNIPLCCFMVRFSSGVLWASLLLRRFSMWMSPQVVNLVLHPLPQWP